MQCDKCKKEFKDGDNVWTLDDSLIEIDKDGTVSVCGNGAQGADWTFCESCEATLDLDGTVKAALLASLKDLLPWINKAIELKSFTKCVLPLGVKKARDATFKLIQEVEKSC